MTTMNDNDVSKEIPKDVYIKNLMKMPINHFAKDMKLRYVGDLCNESTAILAGMDSPKKMDKKDDDFFIWRETNRDSFVETDIQAIRGKPQLNHKETILVADGYHDFLITKTKLINEKEETVGVIGHNICVTGYTMTAKKGRLSIEEKRLYLGKELNDENLTPRQTQVFIGLLKGYTLSEIGHHLDISVSRIRKLVAELKMKLQCNSIVEVILRAIENGWTFLTSDERLFKTVTAAA